jgi:hypothetical protein
VTLVPSNPDGAVKDGAACAVVAAASALAAWVALLVLLLAVLEYSDSQAQGAAYLEEHGERVS